MNARTFDIDIGDDTYHVVVDDYTPVRPGRFDGPPEACYPDEGGEIEWRALNLDGDTITTLDQATEDEIEWRLSALLQDRRGYL